METSAVDALIYLIGILYASPLYTVLSRGKEIKEWKELISQDQLEALISFIESLGDLTEKKANTFLRLMQVSSNPERELTIVIAILALAATFYEGAIQQKRPFLAKVLGLDVLKRARYYEKLIACHVLVSRLYLAKGELSLAEEFAKEALTSFDAYMPFRKKILTVEIENTFWYEVGTGHRYVSETVYYKGKEEEMNKLKKLYQTNRESDVIKELVNKKLSQERNKILQTLASLLTLSRNG